MITAAICFVTLLIVAILSITAVVCVHLFSAHKYGNTNEIAELTARMEEWDRAIKSGPKDLNDRLVALENKAGIMIGARR